MIYLYKKSEEEQKTSKWKFPEKKIPWKISYFNDVELLSFNIVKTFFFWIRFFCFNIVKAFWWIISFNFYIITVYSQIYIYRRLKLKCQYKTRSIITPSRQIETFLLYWSDLIKMKGEIQNKIVHNFLAKMLSEAYFHIGVYFTELSLQLGMMSVYIYTSGRLCGCYCTVI